MKQDKKAIISIQLIMITIAITFISTLTSYLIFREIGATKELDTRLVDEAKKNVGERAIKILEIYFKDAYNHPQNKVDSCFIKFKLMPDSVYINSKDILIRFTDEDDEFDYQFSSDIDCNNINRSNIKSIYHINNSDNFGIAYNLGNNINYSIRNKNIVTLCFKTKKDLGSENEIKISVIPKDGLTFNWKTHLPSSMNKYKTYVFPKSY